MSSQFTLSNGKTKRFSIDDAFEEETDEAIKVYGSTTVTRSPISNINRNLEEGDYVNVNVENGRYVGFLFVLVYYYYYLEFILIFPRSIIYHNSWI